MCRPAVYVIGKVNSWPLLLKFWGSQSYMRAFGYVVVVRAPNPALFKVNCGLCVASVKREVKRRPTEDTHMQPRNLLRSLFGFSHSMTLVKVKGLNSET